MHPSLSPLSSERTKCSKIVCVAILLSSWLTPSDADEQLEQPIRALLVTGGCCHDYDTQKEIIQKGLADRLDITFDVVQGDETKTDELDLYRNDDWASGYDVIIHNECYGGVVDKAFVSGIVKAHEKGVPAVFIHCSMHSYRKSPAVDQWRELIGVTSVRHEGKRGLAVVPIAAEHPVMKGFPSTWSTPNGELYVIDEIWPSCEVLATAYGYDTEREHPVVWTNTFNGTKVFGTTIGHHNETMQTKVWLDLVSRGTAWVTDTPSNPGS